MALRFASAGILLWVLVYILLYSPVQTPFIAVGATTYERPLAPNSWAAEDLAALRDLHGKTLHLANLSSQRRTAERGLERLDAELKQTAAQHPRARVVVLYLSMHGAIDGAGRPCLIPPGAAPHDSQTWLPLATVLDHVRAAGLPQHWDKLIVLDSTRQTVNWSLGQVADGFAAALPQAVTEANIPNWRF